MIGSTHGALGGAGGVGGAGGMWGGGRGHYGPQARVARLLPIVAFARVLALNDQLLYYQLLC